MKVPPQLVIRRPDPARFAAEADAATELFLASRRAALPWLRDAHTDEETARWMRETVFPRHSVWLAVFEREIVGLATRDGAWLANLYVKPEWTRHGIGGALLAKILAEAAVVTPTLRLHTFARNAGARRFYERQGFVPVRFTDGRDNIERCPDVLYELV